MEQMEESCVWVGSEGPFTAGDAEVLNMRSSWPVLGYTKVKPTMCVLEANLSRFWVAQVPACFSFCLVTAAEDQTKGRHKISAKRTYQTCYDQDLSAADHTRSSGCHGAPGDLTLLDPQTNSGRKSNYKVLGSGSRATYLAAPYHIKQTSSYRT